MGQHYSAWAIGEGLIKLKRQTGQSGGAVLGALAVTSRSNSRFASLRDDGGYNVRASVYRDTCSTFDARGQAMDVTECRRRVVGRGLLLWSGLSRLAAQDALMKPPHWRLEPCWKHGEPGQAAMHSALSGREECALVMLDLCVRLARSFHPC